jgi:hypothetical protein
MKNLFLQDDADFLVEVIDWQGRPAVKKSIKPTTQPERLKRLKNEAYGLKYFADLAKHNPQLDLYIPRLYEANDNFIINGYIDAPYLGDDETNLNKLAKLLAGIDRIEPYGEAEITPNFDYRDIRNRFPVWVKVALENKTITQAQLDSANQIIDKYEAYLQPRITHGDMSPYFHVFMRADGKIAFVDLEVFTPLGARYYDVVRCYIRLYQSAKSTDTARRFLANFLNYADKIPHQAEQLMAIFVQRTVGMQRDAAVDASKGEDYKQKASGLLNLVLQDDLELLH